MQVLDWLAGQCSQCLFDSYSLQILPKEKHDAQIIIPWIHLLSWDVTCEWHMPAWFAVLQVGGSNVSPTGTWWMFSHKSKDSALPFVDPGAVTSVFRSLCCPLSSWLNLWLYVPLTFPRPCHRFWWPFSPIFLFLSWCPARVGWNIYACVCLDTNAARFDSEKH